MQELPPNGDLNNSEIPDFDNDIIDEIINGLKDESNKLGSTEQVALSEDDRPELLSESRSLEGQERSQACDLIESVERTLSSAELQFKGCDGEYFLHLAEEVSTPKETANLVRDSYAGDTYTLVSSGKKPASAVFVRNKQLQIQNPADLKEFEATEEAIARGEIEGYHTYSAVKVLAPDPGYGPDAHLLAEITRRSDGSGSIETQLELTLMRLSSDTGSTVRQSFTLESDPNTGNIQAKSALEGHTFVNMLDEDPDNITSMPVADPLPQITAQSLQDRFNPELPVDRDLSLSEWLSLVQEPLQPKHLI